MERISHQVCELVLVILLFLVLGLIEINQKIIRRQRGLEEAFDGSVFCLFFLLLLLLECIDKLVEDCSLDVDSLSAQAHLTRIQKNGLGNSARRIVKITIGKYDRSVFPAEFK